MLTGSCPQYNPGLKGSLPFLSSKFGLFDCCQNKVESETMQEWTVLCQNGHTQALHLWVSHSLWECLLLWHPDWKLAKKTFQCTHTHKQNKKPKVLTSKNLEANEVCWVSKHFLYYSTWKISAGGKAATDHLSQLLSNLICIACNIIRGLGFVSGNVSKAL